MTRIDPSSIDLVLYHANCTDGFGAAYAAWKLLGGKAEYVACKHGDPPPDVTDRNVAILDFSYDEDTTRQMISIAERLVILDHHKSALVELHDIPNAIFDLNRSGAMIAWSYFHPGKEAPKFLRYIEDRDLWKWELPYSREFAAAFDMVPFVFEEFEKYEDASVFDDAVKRGSYILAYSKTVVKKVSDGAVKRWLNDKSVLVVNASHWMSEIGNRLAPDCDFALVWYYDHAREETKVSLRSFHDTIDVSEVAERFGGGGHRKAAGFSLSRDVHIDDILSKVPPEPVETSSDG